MSKSVDEFGVETLEIAGIGSALKALRLPFGKDARSGGMYFFDEWVGGSFTYGFAVYPHDKDIDLLSTLVRRGDEHAKVLRGVVVWAMICAPRYWHVELDTYRIGAERLSSESTMHIQGRGMSEDELVDMKENLPEGTMQRRIWMFSYQTLRRIYFQRRNHRLPQWRKFCEWIEKLPFAKEFITTDEDDNSNE